MKPYNSKLAPNFVFNTLSTNCSKINVELILQEINSCLYFTCSPINPAAPNIEFGPEYFEGLTLKAGDNIRLKVTITGRPTPKVVWYRDGVQITKMMMDIINVAGSSTLFVRDADRTHRGLYTVEATNSSGTKKEDINVQVQGVLSICGFILITQLMDQLICSNIE